MSGEAVVLLVVAVVVAVLLAVALPAYLTAHRLDRLHIRTDLARQSLLGVLGRRHVLAAAAARELEERDAEASGVLAAAVATARSRPAGSLLGTDARPAPERRGRSAASASAAGSASAAADDRSAEQAENELATVLAAVQAELSPRTRAELDDVRDRLQMARGFYNDAVRDTRALRERGWVSRLHLAGHAPLPDFVELVLPEAP